MCKNDDALNNGQFTVDFDGSEVAEALQAAGSAISNCVAQVTNVSAQLEGRLTAINTKLVEGFAQLDRRIKLDFERVFTPVVEAMVEVHEMRQSDFPLKWAGSLPLPVVRRLYRAWKSDGDEAVNLILTTELADDETTEYLVSECRECQTVACHYWAVAEALWAHRQGKYFLSVPVLMTQTEGVLRRTALAIGAIETIQGPKRGWWPIGRVLGDMECEIIRMVAGSRGGDGSQAKAPIFGPFIAFLNDHYFSDYRNPIMHGNDTDYGSVELSAECVLALNEALRLASDVERCLDRLDR